MLHDKTIAQRSIAQIVEGFGFRIIAINVLQKGKTCNNCGLLNHFAKFCRKQKTVKPVNAKKKMASVVEEAPHPEDSVTFLQLA